jgi:uncharacterized protein YkwD
VRVHLIRRAQRAAGALGAALLIGWAVTAACNARAEARAGALADALADAQLLRRSGCAGSMAARAPLQHLEALDGAAAQWASGHALESVAARSTFAADQLAGVHIIGSDAEVLQTLRRSACATLMRADVRAVGLYRRGQQLWLVLASWNRNATVESASAPAARVLELVNAARERGASCGRKWFAPVPPVRRSAALAAVARGHALDMAEHQYFEHQDLGGRTPADRVRASGYREKLVGENIAYGPQTAEEVVRGWLDSPGHCENLMDGRYAEMGIAAAFGPAPPPASGRGRYWVQLLADPRGTPNGNPNGNPYGDPYGNPNG